MSQDNCNTTEPPATETPETVINRDQPTLPSPESEAEQLRQRAVRIWEDRLRRKARTQGVMVRKTRTRNPQDPEYGKYQLERISTTLPVPETGRSAGMTLEALMELLLN